MNSKTIAHGIKGLTQSILHIGLVSEEIQEYRMSVCNKCKYLDNSGRFKRCTACRCFVSPKTKLEKEKCPKGFW